MIEIVQKVSMDEIVKLLQERQGELSPEVFAPAMGIAGSTLRAYYAGLRDIGLANGRKLIAYFESVDDPSMAGEIRAYLEQKLAI
jgi:response regulator of citrate/malate metabolism